MKLNWGWGIAIFLTGFISFILFFLFQALSFDGDLVSENYYDKELRHQETIDAQMNFRKLNEEVKILVLDEFVRIDLPKLKNYQGELLVYRPSSAKLDRKYPIEGDKIHIPKEDLEKGNYQLKISWESDGKSFYTEKTLTY